MALESLLEDAFARGCGISRSYALRTPRYKELALSGPRVPNTTRAETAEMLYLGERLADRAYANLPYKMRKRAEAWPSMTLLEKHAALNLLMSRLVTDKWLSTHKAEDRDDPCVEQVLPAQYGSWSRGKVQPNCLGLSQLLIGFARATQAEYLMVDTVTQHDLFNEQLLEQTSRTMMDMLSPYAAYPPIARLIRRIGVIHTQTLRSLVNMERNHQAHHALLIKVEDGWVLVDPYLRTKYEVRGLSKGTDYYAAINKRPRRRWMLYGARRLEVDATRSIRALENVLELFKRRDEPGSSFGLSDAVGSAASELCWIGVDLGAKHCPSSSTIHERFWRTMTASLLTRRENKRWKGPKAPKSIDDALHMRLDLAEKRKRERNAALVRLIKEVCLVGLEVSYNASRSRKQEHRRIEIAHPALHLAAMTLNHIGHMTDQSTAHLIRFDNSQWIVHDTLREVMNSGDERLIRIAETNLRLMKKYSHHAMPALLVEHEKRK